MFFYLWGSPSTPDILKRPGKKGLFFALLGKKMCAFFITGIEVAILIGNQP